MAKPTSPRPSVGRIVHYFEAWQSDPLHPMAALIIHVEDDDRISVKYTDPHGADFVKHKVHQGVKRGEWNWPERV